MRLTRSLAVAISLFALAGCRKRYAAPEGPLPPNTILLSQMMRELSSQPGFTEAMLKEVGGGNGKGKRGPALLTPKLIDELRSRILGKDWSGLDRYPGWTMSEINPTVRAVGHFAGKSDKLEEASAAHPGAPLGVGKHAEAFLDLGPYAMDKEGSDSFDKPSSLPQFTTDGIVTELGADVTRGDGPNALAAEHSESQRLADMLNRLAVNQLEGVPRFRVTPPFLSMIERHMDLPPRSGPPVPGKMVVAYFSPDDVIADLQATGHTVTVTDSRYFANFGHFHYKGQDVMMPFWVNSQIVVPNSGGRPLLVPVSHAEYEWHIRGPLVNADVSYYFGIDGKSEWRTMDTLDQAWVLKRDAHTYTGADAVEVTRLAGLMTAAYMRLHAAYPELPFGGYYALGVCQDGVSAIEHKMTGHSTLFPNTADPSFFNDPRDAEINGLIASIPKDRTGSKPEPERVFGSLPTTDFSAIMIPGLGADLTATYAPWKDGSLERTHSFWDVARAWLFLGSAIVIGIFFAIKTRRFLDRNQHVAVQRNPYK